MPAEELYKRLFGALIVALAPLAVVTVLLGEGAFEHTSVVVEAPIMALAFGSGLYPSALLMVRGGRRYFVEKFVPPGWTGIVIVVADTLYILLMSTWGFAVLGGFLYEEGVAETLPQELDDPHNDLFYAFLWSFLDAIPTLELPQTIGWERPLRFTDHVSPPLLLLYKLSVIVPVLATAALVIRRARDRARAAG